MQSASTPQGALALCILLDQFPRNLHRGTPAAFALDARARAIARQAVLRDKLDLSLTTTESCFFYLTFEHSEVMADQDLSVALFEGLRDDPVHAAPGGSIDYAWRHRAVIVRFGRFPHRNAALAGQIPWPKPLSSPRLAPASDLERRAAPWCRAPAKFHFPKSSRKMWHSDQHI
jgi:uncharacterized protein (DUF924 family)